MTSYHDLNTDLKNAAGVSANRVEDPGDAGSIFCNKQLGYMELVSAASETRTLKDPTARGLVFIMVLKTDGGDVTITADSAYDEHGTTVITLDDANDSIVLYSIRDGDGTLAWRVLAKDGALVPQPRGVVDVGDVAAYTVLAGNSGKLHTIPDLGQDIVITLPTAAAGLEYSFVYAGVAADTSDWQFDTGSDTNFLLGGVSVLDTTAGDEVGIFQPDGDSNSKLNVLTPNGGTRVNLVCDGTNWILDGVIVSATDPTFADQ